MTQFIQDNVKMLSADLYKQLQQLEQEVFSNPANARKVLMPLLAQVRQQQQGSEAEAYALCLLGGCAFFQGNYSDTLLFNQYALAICQKHGQLAELEARCHNALGLAFGRIGQHNESLDCYYRSLQIASLNGDEVARSRVMINLAAAYSVLNDHAQALELFQNGEQSARACGKEQYRVDALRGVIEELYLLGQADQAQQLLPQAIEAAQDIGFKGVLNKLYCLQSKILLENLEFYQALKVAQMALKVAQDTGDYEGMGMARGLVGQCQLNLAQYDQAYTELTKSERLGEALGLMYMASDAKRHLSRLFEIQGDLKQALTYLKAHLELEEERHNLELARRASTLKYQFQSEQLGRQPQPARLNTLN